MENKNSSKTSVTDPRQKMENSNRRGVDRRKEPCEGYTYVSTVGWICRREQTRRKNQERKRDLQG